MTSTVGNGDMSRRIQWILRIVACNLLIVVSICGVGLVDRHNYHNRLADTERYGRMVGEQASRTQKVWQDWRDRIEKKVESIELEMKRLERDSR